MTIHSPRSGSVEQMIKHFEANPKLGAAGFTIHLPDGQRESSALPHVFVGCGVGFRRSAYKSVGGLDRSLFMQAEEYDLCFRLLGAGWDVERFDDLHVEHLKTPQARLPERTCFYDTRNNLLINARYIPDAFEATYRDEVIQRYRWISESQNHQTANQNAESEAMQRYESERSRFANMRLECDTFERLFRIEEVAKRMRDLRANKLRRVLFAGLGKNIYPFVRSANESGIEIAAIADNNFARSGRCYRGVPIVESNSASLDNIDAIIVSNMSPAHATRTRDGWARKTKIPIFAWYAESPQFNSERGASASIVVPIEQAANPA